MDDALYRHCLLPVIGQVDASDAGLVGGRPGPNRGVQNRNYRKPPQVREAPLTPAMTGG